MLFRSASVAVAGTTSPRTDPAAAGEVRGLAAPSSTAGTASPRTDLATSAEARDPSAPSAEGTPPADAAVTQASLAFPSQRLEATVKSHRKHFGAAKVESNPTLLSLSHVQLLPTSQNPDNLF